MFDYVDCLCILIFISAPVIKSLIVKFVFKKSFKEELFRKRNLFNIALFISAFILFRILFINIYKI